MEEAAALIPGPLSLKRPGMPLSLLCQIANRERREQEHRVRKSESSSKLWAFFFAFFFSYVNQSNFYFKKKKRRKSFRQRPRGDKELGKVTRDIHHLLSQPQGQSQKQNRQESKCWNYQDDPDVKTVWAASNKSKRPCRHDKGSRDLH